MQKHFIGLADIVVSVAIHRSFPATDMDGNPIYWPDTAAYRAVGLAGKQMEGTMPWHAPTTENPKLKYVLHIRKYPQKTS